MWLHHHYAQLIVKNFVQNQVEARNQAATIQIIREVSDLIVPELVEGTNSDRTVMFSRSV